MVNALPFTYFSKWTSYNFWYFSLFNDSCVFRYENGPRAQDHFKSKRHFLAVKNKYRCYFCNAYVQDTKGHLESRHRDMTFQCQLNGCANPRFTQAAKVIDHVRCNHPNHYGKTNRDIELFRKKMISMPKNIMSFTCRECKVVFHGDVKIAIVHLVLEHGQNIPQRSDFTFSCRLCGPKAYFDNEKQLEGHCKGHMDEVYGGRSSRSQSSDRSSVSRSRSRSRSRSPPPSRSGFSGDRGGFSGDRGDRGRPSHTALSCHFCPDQFRTLAVRKNHMLRDHQDLLFQCALCTFHNMYRRDLIWHLKEHHKKNGMSDQVLIKEYVHWPKDLRKIMCGKCSETEAHERAVWLAVDPQEVKCFPVFSTTCSLLSLQSLLLSLLRHLIKCCLVLLLLLQRFLQHARWLLLNTIMTVVHNYDPFIDLKLVKTVQVVKTGWEGSRPKIGMDSHIFVH